jgi:hypothetical protein
MLHQLEVANGIPRDLRVEVMEHRVPLTLE